MKTDLQIHERNLESVAIWQQYKADFTVGTLILPAHAADANLLDVHILEKISTANQLRLARLARNSAADEINAICARVCGAVESTLPEDDNMIKLGRAVRAVKKRTFETVSKRANETLDLWQAFNAHRASMTPAQPALKVDDTTVQAFQSMKGNYLQLLSNVKNKDIAHDGKASQLRKTVKRVDRHNKRWFKAWRSQFGAGTTEREALGRVSTEGSANSLPGQGVILSHELLPDRGVRLSINGARGKTFTVLHQGPGEPAYSVLATDLTEKSFTHTNAPVGTNRYKVVPYNSQGAGAESVPLVVQVAQQQAA